MMCSTSNQNMFVSSKASESKLTIGADGCVVELGIVKDWLYWPYLFLLVTVSTTIIPFPQS